MSLNDRTFMLVPPENKRVRFIRIRRAGIVFLVLVLIGGVAGYFLPVNTLTIDVVELNQKKNISAQNKKLLTKIRSMREMLFTLRRKVDILKKEKNVIESLVDVDISMAAPASGRKKKGVHAKSDDLLTYIESLESFYLEFIEKAHHNPDYLNGVPLIKPVPDECLVTARFGQRRDPFTGDIKLHAGIDFSGPRETPVIATAAGTVDMVQDHTYWGRQIRIRHAFGFSTVYAHLGTIKTHQGKRVKKGEVIATIGLSGLTTGPHLHYEVHFRDSAVDPEAYFFPDFQSTAALAAW